MTIEMTLHGDAASASSLVISKLVLFVVYVLLVSILPVLLFIFILSILFAPLLRLRRNDTLSRSALCLPHAQSAQETGNRFRTPASRALQRWLRAVAFAKPCSHLAPSSQRSALSAALSPYASTVSNGNG